jgi:hypothetical protein
MLSQGQSKHHADPTIPQFGEAIDSMFLEQLNNILENYGYKLALNTRS